MEKAYDLKQLVKKVKSKGLDIAEESAKELIEAVCEWAEDSAKLGQKGVIDAVVLVAAPQLEKLGKEVADKIDGQEG